MAKFYVPRPTEPRFHLLVIERDDVVLYSRLLSAPGPYTFRRRIVSVAQLATEQGPDDQMFCSSSLDFPREYTKSPRTIHLCQQLRGARR